MVAVIAGNGLGLLGTSLQQLGLGGQSGLGQSGASQYVNIATGNLVLQSRDADLVAQGFLAGALRTYNSLGASGNYGAGSWLLGLDRSLSSHTGSYNTAGSTITRTGSDGHTELFTYDTSRGLYVATNTSGAEDTLKLDLTQLTATYTAGGSLEEEVYDQNGRLIGLVDGATGASYTLSYNGSGQLTAVTASDGEALELGYDAQGRVATLSTLQIQTDGGTVVTQNRVSYAYDSLNRLASVTTDLTPDNPNDASVFITTYTYDDTSNRVASLTQSDGVTVSYTYDSSNRVASVTTGSGADAQTLSFSYDLADHQTTVTDASGRAWVYAYDINGNLTSVTSPAVNGQYQVTGYSYTPDGHVASVTDAKGNITIYEYDAHGNRILERDADGNTTTWTYNTDDQVLTRTVYQVPDPDGSGSGQPSDPSTTWYVYGTGSDGRADRLRYMIDAEGDVSETQYNASGQVSMTRSFAGDAYDTSSLDPDTSPTLATMNTWASSSSRDLTRTTRVDYTYDASGRLTGKTAWDEVNSSGAGIADAGEAITTYVYDAQGLLRQQVTERGASRTIQDTTSYSYDGLGRLVGSTDAVGNATTYAYAAGGTLTVTQANGLVHTEVRNSAGELVTVTESAAGQATRTTHYFYDEDGQLRAVEAPDGAITYTFYDATGRISGTVDAMGAVTQYTRDADGNVVETRQYATTVSTANWLSNGAVTAMPDDIADVTTSIAGTSDRISLSLYDVAGLHVADVDAEGHVTTYDYDGTGNLVTTTRYATALTTTLGALQSTPTWSMLQSDLGSITSAADRVTHTFYDVASRAVATLDAAGYVTTTAYDAAGRIVKTTAYANGLTSAQRTALGSAPSLSAVLADVSSSANDQVARNYYDDRGQLIAEVDADGYLTTTTNDETTHTATRARYAQALSTTQLNALTGHESLAVLTGDVAGSTSQTSVQQYDADGRLYKSTAVDGTVTAYTYDAAGNLTGTTTTPPSGAGATRSTSATYDAFGDELTATDGASATTTYTYNTLGQQVLATDALCNRTWSFYDKDGRLTYTVKGIASGTSKNALGEVTAYAYNALGEVTRTTRYAGRLNLTALGLTTSTSLSALATAVAAITNPNADATSTYTYTLDGLTASIKDGLGYTTADTYDAFGDLISVKQQLSQAGQALGTGNSTKTAYTYDARGERTSEVDDAGGLNRTTGVTYDAFGRVVSRTDGNGNITTYRYDPLGRQISVSATVQGTVRTTQTVYDAYTRTVSQIDAKGQATVYQYSTDTHTVIVTTPLGVQLTTTRDAYGDTLSVTDNLNNTTRYTYDGDGRLLTTTDALGHVTHDAYDADGDLLTSTDANGVVTAYTYDAAGRVLTRTLDPSGNDFVTTYTWDGRGQRLSVTDPGGVKTTYVYDANGNVLTMVNAAGEGDFTTTYTWDGGGHQLTMVEGAGTSTTRTTQYIYDNSGRLTQTVVDPSGLKLITQYTYDRNDNLVAKTDADGNVTRYVYDEANEQVYVIDAGGGVTRNWYDADGRVTSTRRYATALTAARLATLGTTPSYTQVAAQVATSAGDQVTYTVYSNDGNVLYAIDAQGYVTLTRHDPNGRDLEVLVYPDALSASTLASLQTDLQQGTASDAVTAAIGDYTDHNAQATLYLRDADGQVRFVVRQDTIDGQRVGVVSETRYDADGRVVASINYGATLVLNDSTDWIYDQVSTSSVAQTLAGTTDMHATYYLYSKIGTLSFIVDPDNYVTQRNYDKSGNLTSEHRWLTAITLPATLTTTTVGEAVQAANAADNCQLASYVYDRGSRLLQVQDNLGTSATYTYDALGQKTSYTNRDGATWTYAYDQAGRLTQETSPQVKVSSDATGNAITTVTAAIVTTYTYDADGNVLTRTETSGAASAQTTYTYDSRGNQIKTTYPGGTYASVTYDALGHAVVNRDVDGHYEYKTYNMAGELAYDVDGNGYVTAYAYDAYGNQTRVTRYATAINFTALGSSWSAGSAITAGDMQKQGVLTTDADQIGGDRTLITVYDQLNRKVRVEQTAVAFVGLSGVPGGGNVPPTTTYTYDAYGNVTSTSVLVGPGLPPPDAPPIPPSGTQGVMDTQSEGIPSVSAATYDYYDALGRKTLEVDPMGYVTTWAYDAHGNVTRTTQYARPISTSGLSTTTPPGLPAAGNAASGFDRTTTYTYDSLGRKATETDTGDYSSLVSGAQSIATGHRTTSWTYDGEDRVTSVTVNGAKTTTTYDALGRVIQVLEPERSVLRSDWQTLLKQNPTQNLSWTSLYEQDSPLTLITYDAFGRVLSTTRSVGSGAAGGSQVTYSHYDALGRVTSETDAGGTDYNNTYDALGNLLTTTYTLTGNSGSSTVTTTNTYDANGQRLSSVTKRGGTVESSTYVKYNAFGEVVAKGDGPTYGGYELSYQYDNAGNLVAATDPETGTQHTYQYDLRGDRVVDQWQATGGADVSNTNVFDLGGRVVAQTAPSSTATTGENERAVSYTYDRWGNVLRTTDARSYTTTYEYDSQNHLIEQTEPEVLVVDEDGTRTWRVPTKEWYYDLNGNALGVTDENGHTTLNAYDAVGKLTATTDAVGAVTRYAYDGLGNQVAKQTPVNDTTTHITWSNIDALGRVVAQGDFTPSLDGKTRVPNTQQTYVLDANGNRIRVTDAMGKTSYYTYDSQGRLLSSQTQDQNAAGVSHTYGYDVNGNKISETTTDKNSNGQFDTESWQYDYYGRVRSHTDLSGAGYTYSYDPSSGLLTTETSDWSSGETDPGYVPTQDKGSGSSETYTYYADGQVKQVTQKTGSATTTTTNYQYDAVGNETDEDVYTFDGAGGVVYTDTQTHYDSHNRISEVTVVNPDNGVGIMRTAYNYDAAGNRRAVFVQSGYGGSPINPGSGGPSVTAIGTQTVQPGTSWSFDVAPKFTDTLGFGLTFAAMQADGAALPSWMHFDSSGTLSTNQSQAVAGSWSITVMGTDVEGNTANVTFTVTVPVVNPVFPAFTPPSASTGVPISFTVPAATDANGSALSYQAKYYNGSSWTTTLPSWLSFNTTTRTWSGTPPAGSAGTWKLAVSANAVNGGSASLIFNLGVSASPPVYHNSLANQTGYGARAFSYTVPAGAFTEVDGSTLTYSAGTYATGGGTALPSWLTFNTSTHTFSGTPPTSANGQSFSLYVKVTNPSGQTAEGHFTLSVQQYVQPAPVYHGTLTNHTGVIGGSSLNLPLPGGAFTEPDGGALTYTGYVLVPAHYIVEIINSEPQQVAVDAQWLLLSAVGLSINATNGAITGVPTTLDYQAAQALHNVNRHDTSYQIKIVATNGQSGTAAGTFTLSNTYAPPQVLHPIANPVAQNPGAGALQIIQSNTFSDPAGYGLTYTVTLSNGSALPGGLSFGGTSLVIGTVAAGSYTIKVTATDEGSASSTFTLTIKDVAPVFASSPSNQTLAKGQAMVAYTAPKANDANGDAVTYSATGLPPGITFNAGTHTFSGTPTTAGSWTVTYKAVANGKSVSKTFTMTVANPVGPAPTYNGGIPSTVSLDFINGGNTYTFPASAFSSSSGYALTYTATGNGVALPTDGVSLNSATRTFTASYRRPSSSLTIVLTATDTHGQHVSHTFTINITGGVGNLAVPADGGMTLDGQSGEQAQQQTQSTTPNIQSYWFTYDDDNRVQVSGGELTGGQILIDDRAGSMSQTYDQAGDVVTTLTIAGTETLTQTATYDARGEQIGGTLTDGDTETRQYDADGRLVADIQYYKDPTMIVVQSGDATMHVNIGGLPETATTYYYDADGHLLASYNYYRPGSADAPDRTPLPAMLTASQAANRNSWGPLKPRSSVAYDATSGYDSEGNAKAYTYSALNVLTNQWTTTNYTVGYVKQDGYLEKSTTGSGTSQVTTTETSYYDNFGRRIAIDTHAAGQTTDQVRAFAYDAEGEILERRDGSAANDTTFTATGGAGTHHYAYVNGQQIGEVDEGGGIDVLSGVTGFSNSDTGSNDYVVQQGDTLQAIAQAVYGDASLWYVVADANGLTSDDDLVAGQTLKLPEVTTNSNTAETFKPYNPRQISGSTTPSLPQAPMPAPSANGCNTLAEIVVVAVVIVASIYTAGLAAEAMGATATAGSTVAVGTTAVTAAGSTSTFAIGAAALSGGGLIGAGGAVLGAEVGIGAAAIGGVVGNIAGQVVGDAEGIHHGISLGEALDNGIVSGITAGVGGELAAANVTGTEAAAIQGAAGYAGQTIAGKLTGQPAPFSWANLVADAVGSAITAKVGLPTNTQLTQGESSGHFLEDLGGGLFNGALDSETARLLGGDAQNGRQIFEDAFGNALGNAVVGEINHVEQRNEAIKQLSAAAKAYFDGKVNNGVDADAALARAQLLDQQGINIFENDGLQGPASIVDPTGLLSPNAPPTASALLGQVQGLGLSPLASPNDPHTYYITAVFDGTDDDFGQMLDPTNPGIFADSLLQADGQQSFKIYEKGVGTGDEGPLMGGAFGLGGQDRVQSAMLQLESQMQEIYSNDPQANIIVNTIGFSRGAAESIDFGNLVQQGVPIPGEFDANGQSLTYSGDQAPQIGAMVLYDPVASFGIAGNDINLGYDLNIPSSAEHVLEITARDESRLFFPLTSAVDPNEETNGFYNDGQVVELTLPGVHSDIGGSYPNPYSYYSLDMGYSFLQQLGVPLNPLTSPSVGYDNNNQGYDYNVNDYSQDNMRVHDSSWPIDNALHDLGLHLNRTIYVSPNPDPKLLYPESGH